MRREGAGTVTGVAEKTVKHGRESQAKHGAKEEYRQKYLMKREFLMQGENLNNDGINPCAGKECV
jgi:hypothetical protein